MARPPSSQPTDVELRILNILWERGPVTARDVHNALAEDKQTNYSTTVKMLAVMLDKELVVRDESVYPMTFAAAESQDQTRQSIMKDLIQKLYDGSAKSLVLQVLSSQQASPDDLDEIRRLIERLESQPTKRKNKKRS
ncbi:MAG: BlaI/MecI/CopY family transcriptional regulator [Planctomycetaceae bacterium]